MDNAVWTKGECDLVVQTTASGNVAMWMSIFPVFVSPLLPARSTNEQQFQTVIRLSAAVRKNRATFRSMFLVRYFYP